MKESIGERFIEGKIINLDKEPIENLDTVLKEVSNKEISMRDKLDNIMGNLMSI